ncbi:MAG: Nif3-like dinuclear metal center hexameric protein [Metamycoplasmataceae bacterium]
MKKFDEIVFLLENLYPLKNANDWDFSGIQYESKISNNKDEKILIALDFSLEVLEYSIKNNCQIIITHHPFIFAPTKEEFFEKYPTTEILYNSLVENNISLLSIHTNFDNDEKATGYYISEKLGWKENIYKKDGANYIICLPKDEKITKVASNIKKNFHFKTLDTNCSKNQWVKKILISPGAGDIKEIIRIYKKEKLDLVVTSDLKWNEKILLNNNNIFYLEVPHSIEEVFVDAIHKKLKKENITNSIVKFYSHFTERKI